MKMRSLGNTDIQVSELCLGTGNFGGVGVFAKTGQIGQKEADLIVGMALDAGINFFNTAEGYSEGLSEEILGKALGQRRKDVIITTKVATLKPGMEKMRFTRSFIAEKCNASLRRLGTDYIDIFELHNFDPDTPMEETLGAMNDLVKEGKVRHIGCSNFTGWQLMKALAISDKHGFESFVAIESLYSLLARGAEFELVPVCLDQGVSIVCWSPLHSGFLSGKYRRGNPWPGGTRLSAPDDQFVTYDVEKGFDIIEELSCIAEEHNATVSQTALNYLLRKPGITSLIVGVRTADHLADNLKATNWEMGPEEVSRLDKISEPARLYPYEVVIIEDGKP